MDGPMGFVMSIAYIGWAKAVRKDTGKMVKDYVAIPIAGELMEPDGEPGRPFFFTLMIREDGAERIVDGITRLLASGPPPDFTFPAAN